MTSIVALGHYLFTKCTDKIELMPWVLACSWQANLGMFSMNGDPFLAVESNGYQVFVRLPREAGHVTEGCCAFWPTSLWKHRWVQRWRPDSALENNSIRKSCAFRSHWVLAISTGTLPQKNKCSRRHQAKWPRMHIFTKDRAYQILCLLGSKKINYIPLGWIKWWLIIKVGKRRREGESTKGVAL